MPRRRSEIAIGHHLLGARLPDQERITLFGAEDPIVWQRRTFHDCAEELRIVCADFQAAYLGRLPGGERRKNDVMQERSRRGVEILRILALAIRSDQDYGLVGDMPEPVGAVKAGATLDEVAAALERYRPPYSQLHSYEPLQIRGALNKIAHADPTRSTFHVEDQVHDLLLTGTMGSRQWVAVVSLLDLCARISALPDRELPAAGGAQLR